MQNAVFFQPYLYLQHNKTEEFHTFVINNNQSFVCQVLKVVNCLSEKFDFSFPWDLIDIQRVSDSETSEKSRSTQSERQNDI